ncbi:MAG: type II secretion system protein [bacterium]
MHSLLVPQRGFKLPELLIGLVLVFFAALILSHYSQDRDKDRETLTKSNLSTIQIALERYAVDHGGHYPSYILGGTRQGWQDWHTAYDEPSPDLSTSQNAWVGDLLIEGGYITDYPKNPFVDERVPSPIGADPRFGFKSGAIMGNGLDDPKVFGGGSSKAGWMGLEQTWRTQVAMRVAADKAVPYAMGGHRTGITPNGRDVEWVSTHWPGNFFYRSIPTRWYIGKYDGVSAPWEGFDPDTIDQYILGGYGATATEGQDLIRLESKDPAGNQLYYDHPPPGEEQSARMIGKIGWIIDYWGWGSWEGGLPEVVGGGNAWQGPMFSPYSWYRQNASGNANGDAIYGAPDGVPDGIIIVLTSPQDQP